MEWKTPLRFLICPSVPVFTFWPSPQNPNVQLNIQVVHRNEFAIIPDIQVLQVRVA